MISLGFEQHVRDIMIIINIKVLITIKAPKNIKQIFRLKCDEKLGYKDTSIYTYFSCHFVFVFRINTALKNLVFNKCYMGVYSRKSNTWCFIRVFFNLLSIKTFIIIKWICWIVFFERILGVIIIREEILVVIQEWIFPSFFKEWIGIFWTARSLFTCNFNVTFIDLSF